MIKRSKSDHDINSLAHGDNDDARPQVTSSPPHRGSLDSAMGFPSQSWEGEFELNKRYSPTPPQPAESEDHGGADTNPADVTMEFLEPSDEYDDAFEPIEKELPRVTITPDEDGEPALLKDGPGVRGDRRALCALPTTGENHPMHDMIRQISPDTMHELLHGGFHDAVDQ